MGKTVGELRHELSKFDDDVLVVLSKDGEGNSFSPLVDVEVSDYVAETLWYGQTYISELTPELIEQGFSEDDLYYGDDAQTAVVLWPTN